MADKSQIARAPKGTHDVLWPASTRWEALLALFAAHAERAGYGLAHTPIFEDVKVFRRGTGEGSDVVGKEMYEFEDKGGRPLALRPEGTAPIVRAWVQHRPPLPWKAWYATPAFRYERPQAGRYRQHHQVGVEALGTADADLDVEVIALADRFYRALGLTAYGLRINSMGDADCRPAYLDLLRGYLLARRDELCPEHQERAAAHPLRVLDCQRDACLAATADAPTLADHLCEPCRAHLARVLAGLDALGVGYAVDHRLVRGFDYYTRTTFEFAADALDAAQNGIVVDTTGGTAARDLTAALRDAGFSADRAFDDRSMKAQFKAADRSGARWVLVVGPDEAASGTVSLRPLRDAGDQRTVPVADVVAAVRAATRPGAFPDAP